MPAARCDGKPSVSAAAIAGPCCLMHDEQRWSGNKLTFLPQKYGAPKEFSLSAPLKNYRYGTVLAGLAGDPWI